MSALIKSRASRRVEDKYFNLQQTNGDPHTVVIVTVVSSSDVEIENFETYFDFIKTVCYDGLASISNSTYATMQRSLASAGSNYLPQRRRIRIQSVITLQLREKSKKVRKIVAKRITEYCKFGDDISVLCMFLNRNNATGIQTKEITQGYCLKDYSRPGWKW